MPSRFGVTLQLYQDLHHPCEAKYRPDVIEFLLIYETI